MKPDFQFISVQIPKEIADSLRREAQADKARFSLLAGQYLVIGLTYARGFDKNGIMKR